MKAAIITGINQISVETVDDPKCGDREVIVEVAAVGELFIHLPEQQVAPQ